MPREKLNSLTSGESFLFFGDFRCDRTPAGVSRLSIPPVAAYTGLVAVAVAVTANSACHKHERLSGPPPSWGQHSFHE